MKKFIIMLLLVFGIILPFRTDFFVLQAAYESGGAVIGSYKVDTWENEIGGTSTFIKFWEVSPSTDSNLTINIISNKTALVGSKDLYFNFDYGEFHITPFEYATDYINSGYQYAPYSTLGSGNMIRIQGSSLQIIDKGDLITSYTLNQLYNSFPDFQYLYIIQLVNNLDYYSIFSAGHTAGYNQGYAAGFADGEMQGLTDGYNSGYQDGFNLGSTDGYNNGYNSGYNDGENAGYNNGYAAGYGDGENVGYINGYDFGFNNGYDLGYNDGYEVAITDGSAEFGLTTLLGALFGGLGTLLSIQLLPNISIGMIIAVPVVFGIISFILGKRGGKDD